MNIGIEPKINGLANHLSSAFPASLLVGLDGPVIRLGFGQTEIASSVDLLRRLSAAIRPDWDRLLGVTDVDLAYTGQTFVFGAADERRHVAVISFFRLRPSPPNDQLLLQRVAKEAAHELGHTYGLRHCANPLCLMAFSSTVEQIDSKGSTFCSDHSKELARRMHLS